jgi:hypothetical protein
MNTMAATSTTSVTRRHRCGPGYSTNAVSHGVTAMPTNVIAPPPRAAPTTPPRIDDRLDSVSCLASSVRSPDAFSVPVAVAMTSTIARSARSRRDLCHTAGGTAAILADVALTETVSRPGGARAIGPLLLSVRPDLNPADGPSSDGHRVHPAFLARSGDLRFRQVATPNATRGEGRGDHLGLARARCVVRVDLRRREVARSRGRESDTRRAPPSAPRPARADASPHRQDGTLSA